MQKYWKDKKGSGQYRRNIRQCILGVIIYFVVINKILKRFVNSFLLCNKMNTTGHTAVSYTHLDVYKRQE